jgi:ArsR family transcriptional regulator
VRRARAASPAACCVLPDPAFFEALADERRLFLVARLAAARTPLTVGEAAGCCGVHVSGASRHLAQLRRAGIVRAERAGREVRYALETRALARALREIARTLEQARK